MIKLIRYAKLVIVLILGMGASLDVFSQYIYYPNRPDGFSEAEYRRGRLILENSYAQIKADNGRKYYADYWNLAIAYMAMGQPKDSIYHFLAKAKSTSEIDFCTLVEHVNRECGGLEKSSFYKKLGSSYKNLVGYCETALPQEIVINLVDYSKQGKFDTELVQELDRILKLDQQYRSPYDSTSQNPLDRNNIKDIEVLLARYGYPGNSLVGEKYSTTAWLVIQHSDLSYQERYLPLIHHAVLNHELDNHPLQMLVDRIYVKRTGKQIFGSQGGVDFADDKTIAIVKATYGQQ